MITGKEIPLSKCTGKTEVYSRIVGYFRPVQQWNKGKRQEYHKRTMFDVSGADRYEPNVYEFKAVNDAPLLDQRISRHVAN